MKSDVEREIEQSNRKFLALLSQFPTKVSTLLVSAIAVGAVGSFLLVASHAATPAVSVEAESGSVSAAAASIVDSTTSSGHAVKFSAGTTTGGGGSVPSLASITSAAGTTGTLTKFSGDYNAASNTTLSNAEVTGSIVVNAGVSNFTATNVKIDGGIYINENTLSTPVPSNLTFRHVDYSGGIWAYGFNGLTLDSVNAHSEVDGPPGGQLFDYDQNGKYLASNNLLIENSWVHSPGKSTSTDHHTEGFHTDGVQGAVFRNNVIDMSTTDSLTQEAITADLTMEPALYGTYSSNFALDGNYFVGGGFYQIYFDSTGTNAVTNNYFYNSGGSGSIQYPPNDYTAGPGGQPQNLSTPPGGYVKFTQSGNMLCSNSGTGCQAVSLPGGR